MKSKLVASGISQLATRTIFERHLIDTEAPVDEACLGGDLFLFLGLTVTLAVHLNNFRG